MRPETKTGVQLLAVGLFAGLLHVALRSGGLTTEAGRGGALELLGCAFIGAVLWAMLTIRSLAAEGSVAQALDDGLTATGVATWLVASAPPRLSNYLVDGATSDFAYAYLPASLVGVLLVNLAVALWPARTRLAMALRLFAATAPALGVLGLLLSLVAGGDDARDAALRAWGAAAASGVVAVALRVAARRRG